MPLAGLIRRNIVLIVSIPTLIAIHYAWYNLQFNDIFVKKEEREATTVLGVHITKPEKKSNEGPKQ